MPASRVPRRLSIGTCQTLKFRDGVLGVVKEGILPYGAFHLRPETWSDGVDGQALYFRTPISASTTNTTDVRTSRARDTHQVRPAKDGRTTSLHGVRLV
jgi:hypothetical protein